jgi:hypothetical protein
MANQRLRSILRYKELEFPKVSKPLETTNSTFRGHVIQSIGVGIYLEPEFDYESDALEFSVEYVIKVRENGSI